VNQILWLWKNFVNGNPEYWAFEHLYPINMDNGDPQTLGEPCGYAIVKPSRPGRAVSPADEQRAINFAAISSEHQQLMKFYRVDTLEELVNKQAYHIEKLQAKLPPSPSFAPQRVREG
jgi:hypothetical protein